MIVFPLNIINKESKIKLVVMRFEREPFEPIYLKLEINFRKQTNFWRLTRVKKTNS